jgi:AcrR family transcriptional regulator
VTKGSFYWHFEDRRALLEAMLEAWRARATNAIIDEVEAKGATPSPGCARCP